MQDFIRLIRSKARPQDIAHCLKGNLHNLQDRGLIPALDIDETDLVSLGLQSLFSHRAGRNTVKTIDETISPTSSEYSDLRSPFPGTAHGSFHGLPDQQDSSLAKAEAFHSSFRRANNDTSFGTQDQFLGYPYDDDMSDGSADIVYGQDYNAMFSVDAMHAKPNFGSFAGPELSSKRQTYALKS